MARNASGTDVPDDLSALENLVSLCAMALEERPLTQSYFDNLSALRQEAEALRKADCERRTCQKALLSRFDASLLGTESVSDWLSRYQTAEKRLEGIPLPASGHYDVLRGIGNIVKSALVNPLSRYLFDHEVSANQSVRIEEIQEEGMSYSLRRAIS